MMSRVQASPSASWTPSTPRCNKENGGQNEWMKRLSGSDATSTTEWMSTPTSSDRQVSQDDEGRTRTFVLPEVEESFSTCLDAQTTTSVVSIKSSPFVQFSPSINTSPGAGSLSRHGITEVECLNKPSNVSCVCTVNFLADRVERERHRNPAEFVQVTESPAVARTQKIGVMTASNNYPETPRPKLSTASAPVHHASEDTNLLSEISFLTEFGEPKKLSTSKQTSEEKHRKSRGIARMFSQQKLQDEASKFEADTLHSCTPETPETRKKKGLFGRLFHTPGYEDHGKGGKRERLRRSLSFRGTSTGGKPEEGLSKQQLVSGLDNDDSERSVSRQAQAPKSHYSSSQSDCSKPQSSFEISAASAPLSPTGSELSPFVSTGIRDNMTNSLLMRSDLFKCTSVRLTKREVTEYEISDKGSKKKGHKSSKKSKDKKKKKKKCETDQTGRSERCLVEPPMEPAHLPGRYDKAK
jgi:hypothetical protein